MSPCISSIIIIIVVVVADNTHRPQGRHVEGVGQVHRGMGKRRRFLRTAPGANDDDKRCLRHCAHGSWYSCPATTTTTTTSTTDGTQGTSVTVPSRPLIGVPQEMASDHSEHNPRGIASPPCTVLPTTPTAAQVRMASYERSSSDTGVEEPQEQRELSPVDTEVTADVLVEGGNDWEFLEAEDEGVTVAVEGTVAPAVAEDTNIPTGPAATDAANAQQE
eukprot:TRINITY_DN3095_c0_g1_i1.p1 TRINITY_DN3095_c0_g1~~TRINITY_DN3095_c0_g1_i1.p1  ORF type:complete len:219 (+),score=50.48 TRINITY_DN3095_c0_g1_i1:208-864(+)